MRAASRGRRVVSRGHPEDLLGFRGTPETLRQVQSRLEMPTGKHSKKFISSAGLRVFATTRKALKERDGQASFVHMQPQIQEVFEIMRSLPGVAVFKSVAELDRYLAVRQRSHLQND